MARKAHLISFILFALALTLHGQQLQPEVLGADGGSTNVGTVRIDWTLGETFVSSYNSTSQRYTEGFHQPLIWIDKAFEDFDKSMSQDASFADQLILFPNPASDHLLVRFPPVPQSLYTLEIWNASGARIFVTNLDPGMTETIVDISHFSSGIYFIHVIGFDDGVRSVYKLSKIN